jgi:hypothetical protein
MGMGLSYPAAAVSGVRAVAADDRGAMAGLNQTPLQLGGRPV